MNVERTPVAFYAVICALVVAAACGGTDGGAPRDTSPQVVIGDEGPPSFLKPISLKFAVIGDSGQWSRAQRETAAQLAKARESFDFDFVLMLGDNNYGDGSGDSYAVRFEVPYRPLLDKGVKFYAALGNHDPPSQESYPLFNMSGHRYYTFARRAGPLPPLAGDRVQFIAIDTVNLEGSQISWLDKTLSESKAEWKIVFAHHPLYSSGRYALSSRALRSLLERVLIEHEADVLFSGHEHFYERLLPQNGVMYFIAGASGSVRAGDIRPAAFHAAGYDRDLSFMLVEIAGDSLYFRAINRTGEIVDRGKLVKRKPSS